MVVFGGPEGGGGQNLGRDRVAKHLAGLGESAFGGSAFALARDEDGRAVAVALVAELTLRIGRVDTTDEIVGKLAIRNLGRVVGDLHGFVMAGLAIGDLFVGRLLDRTPGITGDRLEDAVHLVEVGFDAPEAAPGEYSGRNARWRIFQAAVFSAGAGEEGKTSRHQAGGQGNYQGGTLHGHSKLSHSEPDSITRPSGEVVALPVRKKTTGA